MSFYFPNLYRLSYLFCKRSFSEGQGNKNIQFNVLNNPNIGTGIPKPNEFCKNLELPFPYDCSLGSCLSSSALAAQKGVGGTMYKRTHEWNVCFARGQVGSFGFQKVGASAGRTQCAVFSRGFCGPGSFLQFCSWGLGETHPILKEIALLSLGRQWRALGSEGLNGFLEQFAKSSNVCHLLCTFANNHEVGSDLPF